MRYVPSDMFILFHVRNRTDILDDSQAKRPGYISFFA